jgi:[glutamine synthetase] adenylyltransferase / [glutamine synthetase]-adenylyl-L-tyrosine phosphorylase
LLHNNGFDPRLNVALRKLIEAGLAPAAIAPAMDLMGRMLVTLRLMAPGGEPENDETCARIAHVCGFADGGWPALLAAYADARQEVAAWWQSIREGV